MSALDSIINKAKDAMSNIAYRDTVEKIASGKLPKAGILGPYYNGKSLLDGLNSNLAESNIAINDIDKKLNNIYKKYDSLNNKKASELNEDYVSKLLVEEAELVHSKYFWSLTAIISNLLIYKINELVISCANGLGTNVAKKYFFQYWEELEHLKSRDSLRILLMDVLIDELFSKSKIANVERDNIKIKLEDCIENGWKDRCKFLEEGDIEEIIEEYDLKIHKNYNADSVWYERRNLVPELMPFGVTEEERYRAIFKDATK